MLKTNSILIGVMFCACVFADSSELDILTFERGEQYKTKRDKLIRELKKHNETLVLSKDASRRDKLQAAIINARLRYPEIFEKLQTTIEKAKKNKLYGKKGWTGILRDTDVLKWKLEKFMRQKSEHKILVFSKNLTGDFGGKRLKTVKIQTDEEIAHAKAVNRAARLAVVEHMLKFAEAPRELEETVGAFQGRNPIVYPHVKSDVLHAIEDVLKDTENAKVITSLYLRISH